MGEMFQMLEREKPTSDTETFLASAGAGRSMVNLRAKQAFLAQREATYSVFYLQSSYAHLAAVAKKGKETAIALLSAGELVGEEPQTSGTRKPGPFVLRKGAIDPDGILEI